MAHPREDIAVVLKFGEDAAHSARERVKRIPTGLNTVESSSGEGDGLCVALIWEGV